MQVYSPLCAQSIFNLSVYLRGTKGVRDLYPLSQHENSATVVAVASAGWWPLIGWLELYHGTSSTLLLQSNLSVAVQPDLSLIRLTHSQQLSQPPTCRTGLAVAYVSVVGPSALLFD